MDLVLDGPTALEFWRSSLVAARPRALRYAPALLTDFGSISTAIIASRMAYTEGTPGPIDLLMDSPGERRVSPAINCRAWTGGALPRGSIYRISDRLAVVGPELALVRSATGLTRLELVRAATDLCGTFSINAEHRMDLQERAPVTSVSRIRSYLESLPRVNGARLLRAVTPWLIEHSASPRETSMSLALSLPTRMGGQGLPHHAANERIDLSAESVRLTRRAYLVGDAVWSHEKLVLEYNSNKHHDTEEELEFDFEKITALQSLGYTVLPVSTNHFNDYDAFFTIVQDCRRKLHVRDRRAAEADEKRRVLHAQLLADERDQRARPSLADTARWRYLTTLA